VFKATSAWSLHRIQHRPPEIAFKEMEMRKEREALLVAALAGLVVVGAAAFVVQPTLASKQAPVHVQLSNAADPIAITKVDHQNS